MKSSDTSQRPFPESCIKIWSVELDLLNLPLVWGWYRLELGFQSKIPIKKTFDQPKLIHNSGRLQPKPNPTHPGDHIWKLISQLRLNRIKPNLKLKLNWINETHQSRCQKPKPQSGSSSVLLASSNFIHLLGVLDAIKLNVESWDLACLTIKPYKNPLKKHHTELQPQSGSSCVRLASTSVINI